MFHIISLLALLSCLSCIFAQQHLNITALSASNGTSTLECWQLTMPLSVSTEAGTKGSVTQSLGQVANATLSYLPAGFNGGTHNAPSAQ